MANQRTQTAHGAHTQAPAIITDMGMHEMHSDDLMDGDEGVLDMMVPNAELLLAQLQTDPITEREFKDTVAYEKFMNDPLVVLIHEDKDKNAPPMVPCGINGDRRWLPRGIKIRLQRKFIEVLAQSQETHFETVTNPNPNDDNERITKTRTAQSYGFSVIKDPDPRGAHWLRRVMMANRRRG